MKKKYSFLSFSLFLFALLIFSCSKSDDDNYVPVGPVIPVEPTSPVVVDLSQVPYAKLSDYKFFEGDLKNQEPSLDVLPFEPASGLFTDYASKKRFVWMPKGTKATYKSDGSILELPTGAVLIKNFYYKNVQNISPAGGTRIIETRLMIKKAEGWIFANYVWNAEQTEAVQDLTGSFTDISWKDENNVVKGTSYRIPSQAECITCHKSKQLVNGEFVTKHIPIGIKPQNLNFEYNYKGTVKNQLSAWIEKGYLENNFSLPTAQNSTVNYNDLTKSVDLRARSYVDINCAHCHQAEGHCDYRPMLYDFKETGNANGLANMGVCVDTQDMQGLPPELNKIVTPRSVDQSMMFYRLNTTNVTYRMPLHGRTIIHEEGISLIREWINSLERCR